MKMKKKTKKKRHKFKETLIIEHILFVDQYFIIHLHYNNAYCNKLLDA